MNNIVIRGAKEANLKNITVEIPKNKLVVFTGLSGSGKSTILVDVLMRECQRQYLEALGMQGIGKPQVESVQNGSPCILIAQTDANRNPRSTVGTMTDIYTDLRMVYEKLSVRSCPECGRKIASSDCKEETEKIEDEFKVYMYCSHCGHKMDKLTRTDFSFNTKEGACPLCEGLGITLAVDKEAAVNESLSVEEGAVGFWEQKYKEYQTGNLYSAFNYYGIYTGLNIPVREYAKLQKAVLYEGIYCKEIKESFPDKKEPRTIAEGRFEGVIPGLMKRMSDKQGDSKRLNPYFTFAVCPDCKGERLNRLSRNVTVLKKRLPEIAGLSLEEIGEWLTALEQSLSDRQKMEVGSYLYDIKTKIRRIVKVGLPYLTPDRQVITLSGGELQRIRLAAALDCNLTGMIYILDEPTAGLHKKDTKGMVAIIKKLRDLGNTVLIIEHDEDVMREADYIIDMGPGAGKLGGEVVGKGTLKELFKQKKSVTGQYLTKKHDLKTAYRTGNGKFILIKHANKFNLKDISVDFPCGCLSAVTGVSGSGKSTLIFEVLAKMENLNDFDRVITAEQTAISRMKRSNVATYSDVYTQIRALFAGTGQAKKLKLSAGHFSFNTKGGRCENCEGLGYVTSNMLFFENVDVPCPVCGGKRFAKEVLSVTYAGCSVNDILHMSVEEAYEKLKHHEGIRKILELLGEVGLGYLELGQTLTTLSGGEGQRLKLAKELLNNPKGKNLYLLDEPTIGLHPQDVEHFLLLLNRLADSGNTVIVVEHNEQLIRECDWVVELGPEGGKKGGYVTFRGTPLKKEFVHGN